MPRFALFLLSLCMIFAVAAGLSAQSNLSNQAAKATSYAAIPAEAAKEPNPVKSSPESLERGKKWWTLDCTMCHGKDGNGKGEVATDSKTQIGDFTNPDTLKNRTDGELFYIIKNGYQDMPPEGTRVKTEENWDLVNYVRSLAKQKTEPPAK